MNKYGKLQHHITGQIHQNSCELIRETDFSWNLFKTSVNSTNEDSSEEHVNNYLKTWITFSPDNIWTCLESLIYAHKPSAQVQLRSFSQRCKNSWQVNRIHANYNNLCGKFYTQRFLICVYFLVYFCTVVLHYCMGLFWALTLLMSCDSTVT